MFYNECVYRNEAKLKRLHNMADVKKTHSILHMFYKYWPTL